jgi:hypothetical protein
MSPILAQDYARRQELQKGIYEAGWRAGRWCASGADGDQAQYASIDRLASRGDYQRLSRPTCRIR